MLIFNFSFAKESFLHEYLDSFETFNTLPNRDASLSTLRGDECSVDDFDYAKRIRTAFGCHFLENYRKLYLASDVSSSRLFANFCYNCYLNYKLHPAYFVLSPKIAWNQMLDLKLNLISYLEMFRMIQPYSRGGICHASGRYARANNKYMGAMYRANEPKSFIMYIDATNLYGWVMSQTLTYSEFELKSDAQLRKAETALTSGNWCDTVQFLISHGQYLREHRRVLLADAKSQAVPPVRENI